jgi:hypothetical protein
VHKAASWARCCPFFPTGRDFYLLSRLRGGTRDTAWKKLAEPGVKKIGRKACGHLDRTTHWCFEPVFEHGRWGAAITLSTPVEF